MGAKKIVYGEEARERLLEGIDTVANAIKVTLGPAARTVVLLSLIHISEPTRPY